MSARDPLDLAIDLFLLQGSIEGDELGRLLSRADCDVLCRIGFLLIDEFGVARARASLFPVGERLVFSDHAWPQLPHPSDAEVRSDQVMFVGTDSRWLVRATSRRPVGSALDLCTGSGVQALLAASHAAHVLAVDINPRAARCARANAQACGVTNLEVAGAGNLYGPAGNDRFDIITANPPFVPSPVDALRFRDGGSSGDECHQRIVAGLPKHLAPGRDGAGGDRVRRMRRGAIRGSVACVAGGRAD